MALTDFLNQSATVKSIAVTKDSYGGTTKQESTRTTADCRLVINSTAQIATLSRIGIDSTHTMYIASGSGIETDDIVYVSSVAYQVVDIKEYTNPIGNASDFTKVWLKLYV